MQRILLFILTMLLCLPQAEAAKKAYTLVIDAGHGGHDSGAKGTFSKEKDINLSVALAFGRMVEQYSPEVKVIYTRKKDVFIPLIERAEIANKNHADVFISIHTNAIAGKKRLRGLETYTMGLRRSDEKLSAAQRENDVILLESDYRQRYAGYDPRSPESQIIFEFINDQNMEESVRLARMIQQNVCRSAGRPDKGVKQDAFLVLRETSMPACLVELGYITTPDEERYLNTPANVSAIAQGLYQAFKKYKDGKITGGKEKQIEDVKIEKEEERIKKETVEEKKQEQEVVEEKQEDVAQNDASATDSPVFKVQITMSDRLMKEGNRAFKGLKGISHYKDGKMYKYTYGESNDYQEMVRLRRTVLKQFPEAFVVAFQDNRRIDLNTAIQMWNKKKNK